jgi:pimeloyl-ACP methyl ester carboxylesterase
MLEHTIVGGSGINLHVLENGNRHGKPIIFLHGFSLGALIWRRQLRSTLARDLRLVAFDLRGHGHSEKPISQYSDPFLWAEDVQSVVENMSLESAVFCVSGFGARVFTDYVHIYGEKHIAGVNFVNSVFTAGFAGKNWEDINHHFLQESADQSFEGVEKFIDCLTSTKQDSEHDLMLRGLITAVPPHVRKSIIDREPLSSEPLKLNCPILFSHGLKDKLTLTSTVKKGMALFPNAKTSFYTESAHLPFWEDSERFNEELREFVRTARRH